MQKEIKFPIKTVFYESENEEFSSAVIKTKTIGENYRYKRGVIFHIIRFFFYRVIATPIAYVFCKSKLSLKIKNRGILCECDGEGFFVYANHTQERADAFIPSLALFPKSVYTVVHPDNVSMPVIGHMTPYLGAVPIPTTHRAMRSFVDAVERKILSGKAVVIYPEAHIWPYYTGIRNFPDTSMNYPVRFNCPSYSLTTTYKNRGKRPPRAVSYLDGPFYPDLSLPPKERAKDLRDRIHCQMSKRAELSDIEYIRYIKKTEENEPALSASHKGKNAE